MYPVVAVMTAFKNAIGMGASAAIMTAINFVIGLAVHFTKVVTIYDMPTSLLGSIVFRFAAYPSHNFHVYTMFVKNMRITRNPTTPYDAYKLAFHTSVCGVHWTCPSVVYCPSVAVSFSAYSSVCVPSLST